MTNEETQYMPNAVQNETTTPSPQPRRGLKTGWKRVAIGGVSGIMVGSAAAYAATHLMSNDEPQTPTDNVDASKMATTVNDEMTYEDAFAAARDEVGAGGMFTWKGNVYSTYTPEEWDAMTPQEQLDYYASITGQEVPQAEPAAEAEAVAQVQPQEVHHYHHVVDDTPAQATAQHTADPVQHDQFIPGSDTHTTADNDVHVVAKSDVQQIDQDTYAQALEIDGHAAVAFGSEQSPEVVIIDINDNYDFDPQDVVIDIPNNQVMTGQEFVAQIQQQEPQQAVGYEQGTVDPEPVYDPGLQEVDYDPTMDPANDPGLMDSGMDTGYDMASDVAVYDC